MKIKVDNNERLKRIYYEAINSDVKYLGNLEKEDEINFLNIFLSIADSKKLYRMDGNNFCMIKSVYKENECIIMLFSIPIKDENTNTKISEKIAKIVEDLEKTFINFERILANHVDQEKQVYILGIKYIEKD